MAAAAQKPQEFKDWAYTPGPGQQDSEGSVIDFQKRKMAYDKYRRDFEKNAAAKGGKPAPASAPTTGGAIPVTPTTPSTPATSGVPASPTSGVGPSPGAAPAAAAPAAAAGAPGGAVGDFNLKTPWRKGKGSVANEGKGEFGSENWEAKYNKIATEITDVYNQQMPLLRDYDKMVQKTVDDLIGQTMPQVQEMFRQSGEQYGYAKEFYESSKGYDTAQRRETERGKAMTDVRMAGEASREQALERLEGFGIDPSQARGAALDQNLRLQTALAQAKAGTEAELGVEERGRAYTAQGLGVMNEAARTGQGATATGAQILGQNVEAQAAAKRGAVQTGEAGANLLGDIRSTVGASESSRRAMQASRAATEAAKAGKGSGAAAIGSTLGTIAGGTVGAIYGGPAGMSLGMSAGGALGQTAGGAAGGGGFQAPGAIDTSGAGLSTSWGGGATPDYTSPIGGGAATDRYSGLRGGGV